MLASFTLTCYNPDDQHRSCGVCPSCSERIANFAKVGTNDTIEYSKSIPWQDLIEKMKV
jgi:7-cyano-7-deazaguanine synthase